MAATGRTDAEGASSGRVEPKGLSFSRQLLVILLVTALPLAILSAVMLGWGVREHRQAVESGLLGSARALSIAVDEEILTWRSALQALATAPSLDTGDLETFYEQAAAVARQHGGHIVLFDRSLQQVLNTRRPYGSDLPGPAHPEPIRRVLETGEPQVSGPFLGAVSQDWLVSLDVPVMRDGRVMYSLNISFHPAQLSDLLIREPLARNRIAHLINAQGSFVARSEGATNIVGRVVPDWYTQATAGRKSGVVEGPSPAVDERQILAFYHLSEAPWVLAVAAPRAAVVGVWRQPILIFGGVVLFAIASAVALAWLLSRRFTRPMEALAGAAEDVLGGRAARMDPLAIPEFERLRYALVSAAAAARARIAAEERAVSAEASMAALKASEERQRVLAREIDHRARNLLSVVQAILSQTRAASIDDYIAAVGGRIMALAHSHGLISASRWRGADIGQIVSEELAAYRPDDPKDGHGPRAEIHGPSVTLVPAAAQSIALALHELATNAVKYGALSAADGRLSVDWRLVDDGLILTWAEAGGPPVAGPPERTGFGMRVICAGIERQLGGTVSIEWRPEGMQVTMAVPSAALASGSTAQEGAGPKAPDTDASEPTDALGGLRVLVVEDEALIALQVENALRDRQCAVIGPVSRVGDALAAVRAEAPDAAIVDANLGGDSSAPVAAALRERDVPFIVVTGYASDSLPADFGAATVISKPVDEQTLTRLLARELAAAKPGAPRASAAG